jgi:hypothetical protein
MASTREIVRFAGVLRGQGHEATFTIEAIKVTVPGGGAYALARQKFVSVSKNTSRGRISVNGQRWTAHRCEIQQRSLARRQSSLTLLDRKT